MKNEVTEKKTHKKDAIVRSKDVSYHREIAHQTKNDTRGPQESRA